MSLFPDLGGADPVARGRLGVGAGVGEVAVAMEGAALVKIKGKVSASEVAIHCIGGMGFSNTMQTCRTIYT